MLWTISFAIPAYKKSKGPVLSCSLGPPGQKIFRTPIPIEIFKIFPSDIRFFTGPSEVLNMTYSH
jgi:hypothetical protein